MTTDSNTFAPSVKMHHATRSKAQALSAMLTAEYPRLSIIAVANEKNEEDEKGQLPLLHFAVVLDEDETVYTSEKVPTLADVLDACAEAEIDPSAKEEVSRGGSVVPISYRIQYTIKSSTGRSNGDWLAEKLAMDTLSSSGSLMIEAFESVLLNNNVSLSGKWVQARFSQSPGWQGRFRMNGRQVLEKMVAISGRYFDASGTAHVPEEKWLKTARETHSKWIAKETRAQEATEASIKEATGNA